MSVSEQFLSDLPQSSFKGSKLFIMLSNDFARTVHRVGHNNVIVYAITPLASSSVSNCAKFYVSFRRIFDELWQKARSPDSA